MKNCPDSDRLVDLLDPENQDLETQAHVRICQSCRAELRLIREIPAAFRAEIPVSEALIQQTLAAIDELPVEDTTMGAGELVLTGALGVMTAAAVVVGTGVPASATLTELIGYSLAIGAGVVVYEARQSRGDLTAEGS